jgi:probable HAF family extracellular repeat protein
MVDLGTLGGNVSIGVAFNERVIGNSSIDASGLNHAFLWEKGAITDLGTLLEVFGPRSSFASAICERGQVVGASESRAVLWTSLMPTTTEEDQKGRRSPRERS